MIGLLPSGPWHAAQASSAFFLPAFSIASASVVQISDAHRHERERKRRGQDRCRLFDVDIDHHFRASPA